LPKIAEIEKPKPSPQITQIGANGEKAELSPRRHGDREKSEPAQDCIGPEE